jgi:hypothetical protein
MIQWTCLPKHSYSLTSLICLFLAIIFNESNAFDIREAEGTGGFGVDWGAETNKTIRGVVYVNFYNLNKINPFEFETDFGTLGFIRHEDKLRVSWANLLSASFGGGLNLISSDYRCFGLNPLGTVILLPQILGNFKIHLPIIKDHIHLYIGEATDYYLYPAESTVYTESKAGIKLAFFRFAAECFISKPWLKGYQDSDKLYIGFHVGTYINRKTIEKDKKKQGIFR